MHNLPLMPLLVRRQSADQHRAVEIPAAHRLHAVHPQAVGRRALHQRDRRRLAEEPALHALPALSDARRRRPDATLDRGVSDQRPRRRLLSGRRSELDHAQPVDLSGSPTASRPTGRCPTSFRAAAQQNTGTRYRRRLHLQRREPAEPGQRLRHRATTGRRHEIFRRCRGKPTSTSARPTPSTSPTPIGTSPIPAARTTPSCAKGTKIWTTMWWPAHRPLQYIEVRRRANNDPTYVWTNWSARRAANRCRATSRW